MAHNRTRSDPHGKVSETPSPFRRSKIVRHQGAEEAYARLKADSA